MMNSEPPEPRRWATAPKLVAGTGAILLAGAAVLYGIMGGGGKEATVACQASAKKYDQIKQLAVGAVAALTVSKAPRPAADVNFEGPNSERKSLADFRGKTILLNLWATWCIPCREEMPALDNLQKKLGGPDFEVVAVSIDTARLEKRKTFLDEAGVNALAFYSDSTADIFQRLKRAGKVMGLPTTLLIDRDGCEIGLLAGPADWESDDAINLISLVKK